MLLHVAYVSPDVRVRKSTIFSGKILWRRVSRKISLDIPSIWQLSRLLWNITMEDEGRRDGGRRTGGWRTEDGVGGRMTEGEGWSMEDTGRKKEMGRRWEGGGRRWEGGGKTKDGGRRRRVEGGRRRTDDGSRPKDKDEVWKTQDGGRRPEDEGSTEVNRCTEEWRKEVEGRRAEDEGSTRYWNRRTERQKMEDAGWKMEGSSGDGEEDALKGGGRSAEKEDTSENEKWRMDNWGPNLKKNNTNIGN